MVNKSWVYALAALICLSAAFGLLLHAGLPQRQDFASIFILGTPVAPEVGALAPRFQAIHLDGTRWELNETQDTPIILNFWATWCEPCQRELPELEALQAEYGERLQVIAINQAEDPALVHQWLTRANIRLNVLLDTGAIQRLYQVRGLPSTFLIASDGRISAIYYGAVTAETLKRALTRLIPTPS